MSELFEIGWSATYDETKSYRYELIRQFHPNDTSRCAFVMLNPSTATAFVNDPTVTRCTNFAKSWGHTSMVVLNIFALRSTDPKALLRYPNPIGDLNDSYIEKWLKDPLVTQVVCAWGAWGKFSNRAVVVAAAMREWRQSPLLCLGKTKDGHPKHPLYIRADQKLEVY